MVLDHDSGEMDGRILVGEREGGLVQIDPNHLVVAYSFIWAPEGLDSGTRKLAAERPQKRDPHPYTRPQGEAPKPGDEPR